jgi:histone-lysine N-methyltransferase SETD2
MCRNQRLQNREYAPIAVVETPGKGLGVLTLIDLQPGDLVIEYLGEVLNAKECERRLIEMSKRDEANFYFLAMGPDKVNVESSCYLVHLDH